MKKKTFKALSIILAAVLLLCCTACSQEVIVRFVDKDGNDIFATSPVNADVDNTEAPTDAQTEEPGSQATDNSTTVPDSATATTNPSDSGTAATQAPQTQATVTQAPATQAPATQAPTQAPSGLTASSSKEEIVAKYIQVYNATKASGNFIGHDTMECVSVQIDGKENSIIRAAANGVMGTDASKTYQLPPFSDNNPGKTCATTAADIVTATYKDNGDGTATITLTPKGVTNSRKFSDAQGNMFNVLEDVASALDGISLISWSEGDANSNTVLTSDGGYCEVTFNTSTNIMTKAEYVLHTTAAVSHANVLFLRDTSAIAKFVYTMSYPG